MRIVPIVGDGNCFFASVAYGLHTTHQVLREMCARYFVECGDATISDATVSNWILWGSGVDTKKYAANIRKNGTWGGGLEIAALCSMLHMKIEIYTRDAQKKLVKICDFVYTESPKKVVKVYYNGSTHYDALIMEKT